MNGSAKAKTWVMAALVVALIGAGTMQFGRGARAQEATPAPETMTATVSVNGTGLVTTTPDAASISVGVNVIQGTLTEAQALASTQMTAVIDALKAAGIEAKDIQTTNYSVNIIQDYDTNGYPARITGFQVNNQANVIVRDLTKLGAILDTAVAEGANSIYGISFMVSDTAAATSQARKLAIENATRKAEEIAAATGSTLGRIISVSESYSSYPVPYAMDNVAREEAAMSVPIEGGVASVSVDIQMVFELIQ